MADVAAKAPKGGNGARSGGGKSGKGKSGYQGNEESKAGKGKSAGSSGAGTGARAATASPGVGQWGQSKRDNGEIDYLTISDEDAAFVMGPGGKTKKKIAAVSGAGLELKSNRLEITGTKEQRERCKKYVQLVMAQRVGPVRLVDAGEHGDLSILEVPADAVSFVTGRQGSFLRLVEEEFGALLFFIDFDKANRRDRLEKLAIFGSERERRGAELKVMAAIEMKQPGYFTNHDRTLPPSSPAEGFDTDRMPIAEEDYSYALGKGGATRKKIARASGCIIEYVGRLAYLSGLKTERERARAYLVWLFAQRIGPVEVNYVGRTDVTVVEVPKECVGFVTGHKGISLRSIEDATGTFCFIEGGREDPNRDPKPLLIFGQPDARVEAEIRLRQRIDQKLEEGWVRDSEGQWTENGGWNGRGWGGSGRWEGGKDGRKGQSKGNGKRSAEKGSDGSGNGDPNGPIPHKTMVIDEDTPEDNGDWGDWGGESEDEAAGEQQQSAGHSQTGTAAQTANPAGSNANMQSIWIDEYVDAPLPPQLVNEEAWPELGQMGQGQKKGKKRI